MAIQTNLNSAPFVAMTLSQSFSFLETVKVAVANWRARNETRKELSRLSARELADIGICYADIPRICRDARAK